MGGPEDTATERYFTPPTLSEALLSEDTYLDNVDVEAIKKVFKEWLRTAYMGSRTLSTIDTIESARRLLITLVDEGG